MNKGKWSNMKEAMQSGKIQELTRLQEDLLGDQPKLKYKDLLILGWEGVLKGACLTNTDGLTYMWNLKSLTHRRRK